MAVSIILPYDGLQPPEWRAKTEELISTHPLNPQEIVDVTLKAWQDIFESSIGGFQIGKDIFPNPQMMGFFLQVLITLEFVRRYPDTWQGEKEARDKDLVHIPNPDFSIEIKTSSDPNHIFGNRSYGQADQGTGKKGKNGYYIAVNFQKFSSSVTNPKILKIRFGWLDHVDWLAQRAPTGQQARVSPLAESSKLLELYPKYQLIGQEYTKPSVFSGE
jgi:hypothetical protein